MKALIVNPAGWEVPLEECPPGLFVFGGTLGVKSEYRDEHGDIEVYVADSGECFWGGMQTAENRNAALVTPCESKWVDIED